MEFVFKISCFEHMDTLFEDVKGINIGRLTFYHPTTTRLPVSAVCLLSRQVWKEFGQAVNRIVAQSMEGLDDRKTAGKTSAPDIDDRISAVASLPLEWDVPIVNRMTSTQNRR